MKDFFEQRDALLKLIEESESILVVSHMFPDRDAIGSLVGMYWILKKMGKTKVTLVNESPNPVTKGFIEGMDLIKEEKVSSNLDGVVLVMILDQGKWGRVASDDQDILKGKKVVVIDHHQTRTDVKYDLYIQKTISSNCQILFELFEDVIDFDKKVAKPLLMGIYDDTGGFSYPGVDGETFRVVQELVNQGIIVADIAEEAKSMSTKIFTGGKALMNNTEIDDDKRYFCTYLSREIIKDLDLSYMDIEDIKDNFLPCILSLEKHDWGFLVKPTPEGNCKISFRSKKDTVDVEKVAGIFDGGGHVNASGAELDIEDPKKCVEYIRKELDKHL